MSDCKNCPNKKLADEIKAQNKASVVDKSFELSVWQEINDLRAKDDDKAKTITFILSRLDDIRNLLTVNVGAKNKVLDNWDDLEETPL